MNAHLFGDGNDRAANAGIASGLYHPVTFLKRHVLGEHEIGGRRVYRQHRELLWIRTVRQGEHAIGLHLAACGPGRFAPWEKHTVAFLQTNHALADFRHARHAFRSDRRGELWLYPVQSANKHQVGRVDRRKFHIDDDFSGTGRARVGEIHGLDDIPRLAECGNLNVVHAVLLLKRPSCLVIGCWIIY